MSVPPNRTVINNNNLLGNGINTAVYKGGRLSLLYKFNENWDLGIQQTFQTLQADGVFAFNPALGDLNVQQFNPSKSKDRVSDTAWTLNGKIGALKAVYTGAFLNRKIDQTTDYTAYARGAYAAYYQCNGPSMPHGTGTTDICYSPSATWQTKQQNLHDSHEIRFSTPDDWRLRAVAGVFYEDFKIKTSGGFYYGVPEAGFTGQKPIPGTTTNDPSRRPDGDAYFADVTRGYEQKALFGEVAYDLVPAKLTLTAGTRIYDTSVFLKGSLNSGYGCRWVIDCVQPASSNLDSQNLKKTFSGHADKVNLSWKVTDRALLYATYSVGFRPGGYNLGQGVISPSSPLYGKLKLPRTFDSDILKNYELGWKTTWLDHRLQFNGAVYQEDWHGVILSTFDPSLYGNIVWTGNGPDYRVRGIEGEIVYKLMGGLTLQASAAWNRSEQVTAPTVKDVTGVDRPIFPTAGLGSPLGQSPPFAGNIRVRD